MQKLRAIHLYLGCIFAPMLLFFTVSGIWQMLGFKSPLMKRISSIHTSHHLKTNDDLTSPALYVFVMVMAASFIITNLLGVAMAFKFGRNRGAVIGSLVFGLVCPLVFVLVKLLK